MVSPEFVSKFVFAERTQSAFVFDFVFAEQTQIEFVSKFVFRERTQNLSDNASFVTFAPQIR